MHTICAGRLNKFLLCIAPVITHVSHHEEPRNGSSEVGSCAGKNKRERAVEADAGPVEKRQRLQNPPDTSLDAEAEGAAE